MKKNFKKTIDQNLINKPKIFDKNLKHRFFLLLKDQNFTFSKISKNYVKKIQNIKEKFIKWNLLIISGNTFTDLNPSLLMRFSFNEELTVQKTLFFKHLI